MVGTNVVRVVLVTYLPLLPPDLVCQVVRNEVGDITRGTHAPQFFFFKEGQTYTHPALTQLITDSISFATNLPMIIKLYYCYCR